MDVQTILAIIGSILALMGALGIAYAVFRSATVQKTLDLYKAENEALGKAVARQQADLLTLTAKAEELERANNVLQRTVSGREAVEALGQQLNRYQDARMVEHREMTELLRDMKDQMAELWQAVVRMLGEH